MKIESKLEPQAVDLLELAEPGGLDAAAAPVVRDPRLLYDVPVTLEVVLGEVQLDVKALVESKVGSLLTLQRSLGDPVEVRLNRRVVARGELVAVGDHYGVRVTEIADPHETSCWSCSLHRWRPRPAWGSSPAIRPRRRWTRGGSCSAPWWWRC